MAPAAPPLHRHRSRSALPHPRLLVEPRRLDPVGPLRRNPFRRRARPRPLPRTAVPRSPRLDRPVVARCCVLVGRRLERPGRRVLRVDVARVARDVPGELRGPRVRPPALRHRRHEPQLARSRSRRWARVGTTTITTTPPPPDRACDGGRSTRPTACCACSRCSAIVRDLPTAVEKALQLAGLDEIATGRRSRVSPAGSSLTTILPMFSPVNIALSASGADSSPSKMCVR